MRDEANMKTLEEVFGESVILGDDTCKKAFAESIERPGERRLGMVQRPGLCSGTWHFGGGGEWYGLSRTLSTVAYVEVSGSSK